MVIEALGILVTFFLSALIGLGPALWFVKDNPTRLGYGFGISPIVGYVILGLLGFPLARYLGPVQDWALWVTFLLLTASLVLAGWQLRGHAAQVRAFLTRRLVLGSVAFLLGCFVLLSAPLALKGIQYSIFRSNPSDAFSYMSRAEFLREAPWRTILNGIDLTAENANGVAQLAELSPTAIFSARTVSQPVAMNKPAQLAWYAQILGLPVYRFYFASHLLALLMAVPLVLLIGHQLRLSRLLWFLGAAAITIGYWSRFILETDAGYEISSLPLLLFLAFAWIELEKEKLRPISRARLLLALVGATIVAFYFPLVPLIVLAFVLFYGLGIVQRVQTFSSFLLHGVTALLAVGILGITGQLDFYVSNTLYLVLNSGNESAYPSELMNSFRASGLGAVWGMPASPLAEPLPRITESAFPYAAWVIGIILTAMLLATAFFVIRRTAPNSERIIFAVLAAGLAIAALFLAREDLRSAGKAFGYVYPYLMLGVLIFPTYAPKFLNVAIERGAYVLLVGWLVAQCLIGTVIPFLPNPTGLFVNGDRFKAQQFDLTALDSVLSRETPQLLLVDVPRTQGWVFAYYTMFALDKYTEYYQSGIILDNNTAPRNLWPDSLERAPDYAVILKDADYIGPAKLGEPIAQTPDLILYRVTDTDLAKWNDQEARLKEQEAGKTEFKMTLPSYFSYK